MTSLDSSLAKKNKKYKQKVNIKAKFTHHHPSPEIEKQLSPWDEDDHFIQLPKNPLTMSLQHPVKPQSSHNSTQLWSPKSPCLKVKALYDPKPYNSEKQEAIKPSLISIEFDHQINRIMNKTQRNFSGNRYVSKDQPAKVKLFKKIFQNPEKALPNFEENVQNKSIQMFSTTFTEQFKMNEDVSNLICPALPRRSPKFTNNKKNTLATTKKEFFPTLNHKKEGIEDKLNNEKKIFGDFYMKGGEQIKKKIRQLVKQQKGVGGQLSQTRPAVFETLERF